MTESHFFFEPEGALREDKMVTNSENFRPAVPSKDIEQVLHTIYVCFELVLSTLAYTP